MTSNTRHMTMGPDRWDRTAHDYNAYTDDFTAPFGRTSVDIAFKDLSPSIKGLKILDVAAGTGAVALYAAKQVGDRGEVLATDFSEKMLSYIDKRNEVLKLTNIKTQVMDGMNLTVPDNSIDFYFSSFGLMMVPDTHKGLQEAYRVLKNNAKFTMTSWTLDQLMMRMNKELNIRQNPDFKQPPMPMSLDEDIRQKLSAVGFKNIEIEHITHSHKLENYGIFLSNNLNKEVHIERLGEEGWEKYKENYMKILEETLPLPIVTKSTAIVISATK